jgi:molecular chaperone HscB
MYFYSMNYFELFNLPVSIIVDTTKLTQQYFALQKKYHPDFFTTATEAEQEEALEVSAQLNKALQTLKNKDATLQYILTLKGVLTADEKYQLPPDFLMEMMELNESYSSESAATITAVDKALYDTVAPIIENYNDSMISLKELIQLKDYYFKKKYLQRILDRTAD